MSEQSYPRVRRRTGLRVSTLGVVVVALTVSMWGGMTLRAPCTREAWSGGLPWHTFCYTDILVLYQHRHLDEREVPYLQAYNEYPVGTALFMYATALPASGPKAYLSLNIVLLAGCALATALILYQLAGRNALFFAAAPTLLLGSFINWDLFVIAIATAATAAFLKRRDPWAGILVGAGAATKLYPALLLLPFVFQRLREGNRRGAAALALGAAGAWTVVNVPVLLVAPARWATFFTFNSARAPEWASPWSAGCRAVTGEVICSHVWAVNVLSTMAFVLGAAGIALAWRSLSRRADAASFAITAEPWTLAFPAIALFLLTAKVYSPQYSMWLLPWFALVFPSVRWFVAFEIADVTTFFLRFSYNGRFTGVGGAPLLSLEAAVLVRTVLLGAIIAAFLVRRRSASPARVPATS
jgi:uncharacterized membrane protein